MPAQRSVAVLPRRLCRSRAFSLIELMVVMAVVVILASLLFPALEKAKFKAQGIQCLNNHRQLLIAWKMYTDDNNDRLLYASELPGHPNTALNAWVTGTLDFSSKASNWDPELTIKISPMWPYCGNSVGIWKCPSDRSFVMVGNVMKPRVRSMSMNVFLGGWGGTYGGWGPTFTDYKLFMKQSDFMLDPGPANTFVFLDMREDSIDMGNFATRMVGWPDKPEQFGFCDLPGYYHHFACGFSFADGHSEIKRWRDIRTMKPLEDQTAVDDMFVSTNNVDVGWLQMRSTRPRN